MNQPTLLSSQIRDVFFGKDVKVVQPVNLYECRIGDDCFIGHGVMFINDVFASGGPAGDKNAWKVTSIGSNVSIGSNATLLPVSICDGVVIGAGAVITKDIKEKGIYAGNPARLIRRL